MESEKQHLRTLCTADLNRAVNLISKYIGLANLHNTNFITSKYWQQVPPSMKESLDSLPAAHMSGLLMQEEWETQQEEDNSTVWQASCDSLPQEMVGDELQAADPDLPLTWHHTDLRSFMGEAASFHLDQLSYTKQCEELYHHHFGSASRRAAPFVKHSMGEKKSHEVELMAEACSQVANSAEINQIVDLGSGKGYLATTLAMQYGYDVIGIDSQDGNTHGAIQRKQRLEKQYKGLVHREELAAEFPQRNRISKRKARIEKRQKAKDKGEASEACSYTALTAHIGPEDNLEQYIGDTTSASQCMLAGLHTCGNLAVSMAKLFLCSDSCKAMLNVGCCYHHVDEMFSLNPFSSDGEKCIPHFPMSSVLIHRRFGLGRNCRMLSMQAMEKSAITGVGGGLEKSLFWRALLQQILLDINGFWRKDWIVGKISSKCSTFTEYAYKALKKLKIDSSTISPTGIDRYLEKYSECERQMSMFFQLRTALSPCIESILLLDRCLYLLEQDNTSVVLVKRLFDPVQSPRCYGIIANKKSTDTPS